MGPHQIVCTFRTLICPRVSRSTDDREVVDLKVHFNIVAPAIMPTISITSPLSVARG